MVLEDYPGDLKFWYRHISKGAWPFSTADQGWPISDCTAEGLKAVILLSKLPVETVGEPLDMKHLSDAVNVILSLQIFNSGIRAKIPTGCNCGANMTPSSNISSVIPVFNGEHYHIWAVKMRFYLRSQGLWNVVMSEADPPPLGANPTVAQMKAYEEEKLKKDKAITCLHSGLADHIFTKIMNLETPKQVWDKLQGEFEGSERVKNVRLLTLKREFELMKMKDDESVKDYSGRLMDVVNQMRLLELTSKLHAQEQRVLMRGDEATEGAFQANHKGKNSGNLQGKKFFKNSRGKAEGSSRKGKFPPCSHCKRTNHAEKDCWHKVGCTSHMTKHLSIFTSIDRSVQPKVKLGNGEVVQAKGKGTIAISTKRGHVFSAKLMRVLFGTKIWSFNLKSLRFMQEAGMVEDMLKSQLMLKLVKVVS
ncbi:Cycloartenol synthase [Vitis vinifera]|uniref:Cycloartenol synthase n=1 Tax=Vitis vinifera TaxID=29760 RepID=A0A438CIZ8_VITVI|nr:Cycloartenol synthase [Vitis vinifera]